MATPEPRHRRIRAYNMLLADSARTHRFDDDIAVPFRCECDDDACEEYALLTLPQFSGCEETVVFTTPAHTLGSATPISEAAGYRLYATQTPGAAGAGS